MRYLNPASWVEGGISSGVLRDSLGGSHQLADSVKQTAERLDAPSACHGKALQRTPLPLPILHSLFLMEPLVLNSSEVNSQAPPNFPSSPKHAEPSNWFLEVPHIWLKWFLEAWHSYPTLGPGPWAPGRPGRRPSPPPRRRRRRGALPSTWRRPRPARRASPQAGAAELGAGGVAGLGLGWGGWGGWGWGWVGAFFWAQGARFSFTGHPWV